MTAATNHPTEGIDDTVRAFARLVGKRSLSWTPGGSRSYINVIVIDKQPRHDRL
jgi:hypothetical protein